MGPAGTREANPLLSARFHSPASRPMCPFGGIPLPSHSSCYVSFYEMSMFVEDVRRAVRERRLPIRFRPADVRIACPGWAHHTYGVFLPKHRRGNPGGYTAYFERHDDGSYSLLPGR